MKVNKCALTGKTIFSSVSEAKDSIFGFGIRHYDYSTGKRINRRVKKRAQRRVYYCEGCKGYHLTSQEFYIEDFKYKTKKK